jgi:hypothetical protein
MIDRSFVSARPRSTGRPAPGSAAFILGASLLAAALTGCGGAGDPPPGWGDNLHSDITLASDEKGGGRLAIAFDFTKEIEVAFVQCFGGSDAACTGGVRLYAAEDPGFTTLKNDDPDESLFVLPDDVEISLEITAADPEVSLFVSGKTLQDAADSAVLGTTPEMHAHGSWQLAIPADDPVAESYAIAFKLTTGDGFADSAEYVALLVPAGE